VSVKRAEHCERSVIGVGGVVGRCSRAKWLLVVALGPLSRNVLVSEGDAGQHDASVGVVATRVRQTSIFPWWTGRGR
jgi:hypothetical protein